MSGTEVCGTEPSSHGQMTKPGRGSFLMRTLLLGSKHSRAGLVKVGPLHLPPGKQALIGEIEAAIGSRHHQSVPSRVLRGLDLGNLCVAEHLTRRSAASGTFPQLLGHLLLLNIHLRVYREIAPQDRLYQVSPRMPPPRRGHHLLRAREAHGGMSGGMALTHDQVREVRLPHVSRNLRVEAAVLLQFG